MRDRPPSRALQRAWPAVTGAVVCLLVLALTGLLALAVHGTRAADGAALRALVGLDRPRTHTPLVLAAGSVDPLPFAAASLILVGVAVARRRWVVAALVPLLLVGSGATTQVLKHIVATPRFQGFLAGEQISDTAWPSGHSTAAMALALALVLVVPRVWRPLAAVGGGVFTVCVGVSLVALRWHYASDVVGGFLCAAVWALCVVAVVRALDRAPQGAPAPASSASWRLAATLLVVCVAAAFTAAVVIALARPDVASALARPAAVAAVAGIAALATAIPLGTSGVAGR